MTNGRWKRARTTEVWGWVPEAGAAALLAASGPSSPLPPLLPTGPRKGEEVEEKWAPAERVSE